MSDHEEILGLTSENKALAEERERWLASLKVENRSETLFELELLVKGLDRFFIISNQPISDRTQIINRDFSNELRIVYGAIVRATNLVKRLFERDEEAAYRFRSYVQSNLLKDTSHERYIESCLYQPSPRESLYMLNEALHNFREILFGLLNGGDKRYPVFKNLGQLMAREIAVNKYFNPFKMSAFSPAYDRMTTKLVASTIQSIKDEALRRQVSIAILGMFRMLHYLDHADNETEDVSVLKQNLLVLTLVRSEVDLLMRHFEVEAVRTLGGNYETASTEERKGFMGMVDSLGFQSSMESRKIFDQVLRDIAQEQKVGPLRSAMESSKGMLANFAQQSVVAILQVFNSDIEGEEIFPSFVSKLEQSMRLREDIWIFHQLFVNFMKETEGKKSVEGSELLVQTMKDFIVYFMSMSFKLVRYSDHDHFHTFFDYFMSLSTEELQQPKSFSTMRERSSHFIIYLETTIGQIRHRSELQEHPFDENHARRVLMQFL